MKGKTIDDLNTKENHCEQELDAALVEFQPLSRKAEAHDPYTLGPAHMKYQETMSPKTVDQLKSHFDSSFSHRRLQSAESDVGQHREDGENTLGQYIKHNCLEKMTATTK